MLRQNNRAGWRVRLLGVLGALCAISASPASADAPALHMQNVLSATVAEVALYDVRGDQGQAFLDAMVQHGPYNHLMAGAVGEKLLAPLPGSGAAARYISLSRYLDSATGKRVEDLRQKEIAPLLNAAPERVTGKLVQHVFADWGWEKGRAPKMMEVQSSGSESIFEQRLTTLSYLKTGYTGQAGMIEFFDAAYSPTQLRDLLMARTGLTGASIYVTPNNSYFVYSEYFNSPTSAQQRSTQLTSQRRWAGTVEVNYAPR